MYCRENNSKMATIDFVLYLLQKIRAKQFLRLDEEEEYETFFSTKYKVTPKKGLLK